MNKEQLQNLIKNVVVKAVVVKATAALPFLAWPGFNWILSFFVGKVFDLAYDEIERGVVFMIIDAENKAKVDAYLEAAKELEKVLSEKGIDDEETKKASEEFDKRLERLIVISRVRLNKA